LDDQNGLLPWEQELYSFKIVSGKTGSCGTQTRVVLFPDCVAFTAFSGDVSHILRP